MEIFKDKDFYLKVILPLVVIMAIIVTVGSFLPTWGLIVLYVALTAPLGYYFATANKSKGSDK